MKHYNYTMLIMIHLFWPVGNPPASILCTVRQFSDGQNWFLEVLLEQDGADSHHGGFLDWAEAVDENVHSVLHRNSCIQRKERSEFLTENCSEIKSQALHCLLFLQAETLNSIPFLNWFSYWSWDANKQRRVNHVKMSSINLANAPIAGVA